PWRLLRSSPAMTKRRPKNPAESASEPERIDVGSACRGGAPKRRHRRRLLEPYERIELTRQMRVKIMAPPRRCRSITHANRPCAATQREMFAQFGVVAPSGQRAGPPCIKEDALPGLRARRQDSFDARRRAPIVGGHHFSAVG